MGTKYSEKCCFPKLNHWFLLFLIGLLSMITAQEPSTSYKDQIAEAKEKLLKMIQKETLDLSGFDEFATIPITYPLDICLMEVNNNLYAACLGLMDVRNRNKTILKIFKKVPADKRNPLYDYVEIFTYVTRSAQSIDCASLGMAGFVSVVNDVKNNTDDITKGSPIFQLKNDELIPIQYFMQTQQRRIQFLRHKDEFFLWQTFRNIGIGSEQTHCPIFKWIDSSFNEIGQIPCMNAMQMEPFLIGDQVYVAVANYMDERQNIETYSTIFHYDHETRQFNLTQKMKTFGAIDVKHVHIGENHFLFVANSFHARDGMHASTSNGVVYRFDEQSTFVPIQILPFDAEVTQFLPYLGDNQEFMLLVSMEEGPTKTYQFDGFIFYETPITFTGGSLGRGVSKMRTFKMNNDFLVVVVANSEMYRDATNLFRVRFTVTRDYDFSKAFEMFDSWYKSVDEKLRTDRIEEIYHELETLQPPPGFGVINLEETKVKIIQTDTISSSSIPIDFNALTRAVQRADEIISREGSDQIVSRRPKRLNDSMLQNDMNSSQIDIDVESQEMPKTLIVNELTVSGSFLAETINGYRFSDWVREDSNLMLQNFTVDELVIENTENFKAIEKMLMENENRVKRDAPIDAEPEPLNLKNIVVDGLVNGFNFTYLVENALKTNVDNQRLEAPINFGRLKANSIQTTDGKISNIDLATIARINSNETIIRSPIRFTQSLEVDRLVIIGHLNQISIHDGKLDVLFKRSRQPQVITGQKTFESIVLLEPITLQGKINISSSVLNKMKPIVTVNEDLVIEDSVSFIGNVTVKNLLSAGNIYGQSLQYNLGQVVADGLKLNEDINIPLEFLQPFQVGDIQGPTQINNVPISSLLRRNVTDVQKVTAPKTFTSDLSVEGGNCDANEIDGINLQILNNTMLKRSSKNQIVTGTIHFDKITAQKVKAGQLLMGKVPFDRLLTTNTDQNITGNVTIHGSIIMNTLDLDVDHLFTQNHIFGVDLQQLLDDSYFYAPNDSIILTTEKSFENLTIGQLVIEGDFWQIDQSTEEIVKRLEDLRQGIRINGPITFTSSFNINNLTVTDYINGILCSEFGKQWLLSEGKQTFVVPQNFTDVTFNDNLQVYGLFNGVDIDQLFDDTVNINEPISLKHVIFDNVIFNKSLNIGGKLSGIQIPNDLILSYSETLQNFNEPLSFASDVEIVGTLSISDSLNSYSHEKICELLEPPPDSSLNLTIKGDVIFATDPTTEYLNSESFQHMLLTTWFRNDQYVNFSAGVHLSSAVFEKPITVAGLINDINLQDLQNRYLSMNKPQTVTTPLRFHGRVNFMDSVTVDTLSLGGLIKVPQSDITLNITEFDQNVLKNTKDTQFIRGQWTVNEMRFLGNLSATTVNGLNFAADIARTDRTDLNIIRATKRFRSLTIDELECRDGCTMQGVDMDDWISRAAMTGLNHTIQGTVYARNPVISNIEALGLVNNMTINSQTVLLTKTPQTLKGPLIIGNRSRIDSINSLTFDNIYVNYINDKNITEFLGNLVKKDGRGNDVGEIFSHLQFTNQLNIENLKILDQLNGINVNEITSQDHYIYGEQYRMATTELDFIVDKLGRRERFKHFKRMEVRKTFPLDIQGLRKLLGYDFQFVALNNSNIEFYTWNITTKTLDRNNIPLALPKNMVIIDLTVLHTDLMHFLVIQMQNLYNGQFVNYFYDYKNGVEQAQLVYEITSDTETTIEPFNLDVRHCFVRYRKFNATQFDVQCMDVAADSESQQLKVHQIDAEKTSEIYKITSGYANAIILWYINGEIESRWYDTQNRLADSCTRQFTNVTSVAVKKFATNKFVTICWHSNPIGRYDVVKGFASVYRVEGAHLEHYADIEFSDSVILQCELTKFSDAQTILVISVRNSMGEKLQMYQDKGVNGFQALKEHAIRLKVPVSQHFLNHIVPEKRFSLIESENGILSFISVYSEYGVGFFECIYV